MRRLVFFGWVGCLLLTPVQARADETVVVCYHYDCAAQAEVVYSEARLENVRQWLFYAEDAATERRILAGVMAKLYRWAGEQSPIHADKGGDYADDGVEGRMDCLDHSATTTRLLKMLEARGWLRFHRVIEPVRRREALGLLQHFSAAIEALPGRLGPWRLSVGLKGAAAVPSEKFVVDTWFHDHGEPAEVMPLQRWLDGEGPNV
jgi:hypothetical protein